jgi:hypothetical protein
VKVSARPPLTRSHLFSLMILLPPLPALSDQPSVPLAPTRTHLLGKRPVRDHPQTHTRQTRRGLPGLLVRLVRPRGFGKLVRVIRPAVDRGDAEVRVTPGPGFQPLFYSPRCNCDWCAGEETDSRRKRTGNIAKVGGCQRGVRVVLEVDVRLGAIQVAHARCVLVLCLISGARAVTQWPTDSPREARHCAGHRSARPS